MQNQTPHLRFPEFTGDWDKVLLDNFAKRGSGHTPSKSNPEYYNGEINWISLTDSKKLDNGYIEDTNTKITPLGIKKSSAVLHEAGSVLLSRDAGVGKSAVMKHAMAVSQHFIVWTAKEGLSSNWFLYNILQILKPEFERIAIGNTIKTIGLPYFKKLIITVPSFPEQTKIATFLTAVDEKLTALKQKKTLLAKYKKGAMQKIFSQELRFKDDNGNDFADWEEKKLGEIGEIITGKTPSTSNLDLWNGSVQFVTPTDINESKYQLTTQRTVQKTDKLKVLPPTTIMFTCIASIGKMSISIYPSITNQQINSIIPSELYENEFVYYSLLNITDYIKSTPSSSTLPLINKTEFSKFIISVPSISEQTKIANFLSAIDDKINHCNKEIAQTQTWKKGLLQQLFV